MKFLLEFKNYNDISIIQDVVQDVFLSEFDEPKSLKVSKSFISLSGTEIKYHNFAKSENYKHTLEFNCYLVEFREKINPDQYEDISDRIEHILRNELDSNIICIKFQSTSINEFIICDSDDYQILLDISRFQYSIEDSIYEIENNEYSYDLDISTDQVENHVCVTLWIKKFKSKFGLNLMLIAQELSNDRSSIKYEITPNWSFNSSRTISDRWVQDVNLKNLEGSATDINLKNWIEKNLPELTPEILSDYLDQCQKLLAEFTLDLSEQPDNEASRFINLIREKIFPLFSSEVSENLTKLYDEFRHLENLEIEATWTNEGNYLFLFDINYKNRQYIFHIRLNIKDFSVLIELREKNISELVPIDEVSNTLFLILQEN